MVTKTVAYHAKGSSTESIEKSETSLPSKDIADVIMRKYFAVSRMLHAGSVMYKGDQMQPGGPVDRDVLDEILQLSLNM
jgi:hypothetical protein